MRRLTGAILGTTVIATLVGVVRRSRGRAEGSGAPDARPAVGGRVADGGGRVVWIVNQYTGSPEHGMEFRHYELGRELQRLGWTVVLVSGSYSHLYARQPATTGTFTFETIDGLTYCWVRVPRYERATSIGRVRNMVVFMVRLFRLPTDRLPTPDAIVVSSPSLFPILPAERWARAMGAALVFEVRDLWPLTLRELGGLSARHPLILLMSWFERRAYRRADLVVSVLPAATEHLVDHGATRDRIRLIPNGVGSEVLESTPGPTPEAVRAATSDDRFIVGFVGTLGHANTLELPIEAAKLLVDVPVRFVIVGAGPEDEHLRALAAGLSNVTFTGPVAKADVPATLRAFDVCYVGYHRSPLYRYGISPNKVFDYMAAGRPVIMAADAANDPVAEAGCGLSVAAEDPAALAAAIETLRAMAPAERERMGAAGRAFVEREHAYEALAGRFDAALTDAIALAGLRVGVEPAEVSG